MPLEIRRTAPRWRCLQRSATRHPHRDARWICPAYDLLSAPLLSLASSSLPRLAYRPFSHLRRRLARSKPNGYGIPESSDCRTRICGSPLCPDKSAVQAQLPARHLTNTKESSRCPYLPMPLGPLSIPLQELLALNRWVKSRMRTSAEEQGAEHRQCQVQACHLC
jgi:hypothetical protein